MSSQGASTPADASTLGTPTVTSLNVGMNAEDSFKSNQGKLLKRLAGIIVQWLEGPGSWSEPHSSCAMLTLVFRCGPIIYSW